MHRRDSLAAASCPLDWRSHAAALAHAGFAFSQRVDRTKRSERPQGGGLLARAPGSGARSSYEQAQSETRRRLDAQLQAGRTFRCKRNPHCRTARTCALGRAPYLGESARERRIVTQVARAARLSRLCREIEGAGFKLCSSNRRACTLSRGSHAAKHEQFSSLRPRRDSLQPAHGDLLLFKENMARRIQAGGFRWWRTRCLWARDGDIERAHARRLVRRLRSHWPSRFFLHLRSFRTCNRFDVQPACQMAGEIEERTRLARANTLDQHPHNVSGVAPGSQRLYSSGSRIS